MTTIGAYSTTYNCISMHYPFREAVESWLGFADEVVLVDAGSTDGTWEEISKWSVRDSRLKVFQAPVDFGHRRWAIQMDGSLKAKSRGHCTTDFLWQVDNDEIVPTADFQRIRQLPAIFGGVLKDFPVVHMPMVEFWGTLEKVRADFVSWKPRFSVNDPRITHGIPLEFRMVDRYGDEYPRPFESDSCNYIYRDTRESVPVLFPMKLPTSLSDPVIVEEFYNAGLDRFPCVLHASWLSLHRKLRHYKNFWPSFHASMYNLDDADMPKKNAMFGKRWSEVTEADIDSKVKEMLERGPYFFGDKSRQKATALTIPYRGEIPGSLKEWFEKESRA